MQRAAQQDAGINNLHPTQNTYQSKGKQTSHQARSRYAMHPWIIPAQERRTLNATTGETTTKAFSTSEHITSMTTQKSDSHSDNLPWINRRIGQEQLSARYFNQCSAEIRRPSRNIFRTNSEQLPRNSKTASQWFIQKAK